MIFFIVWYLLGVPVVFGYLLLFKPWCVKPLHRFVYVRLADYRRWCFKRWIHSIRENTKATGRLSDASLVAASAMRALAEACR